jgi:beta-lactamase class A
MRAAAVSLAFGLLSATLAPRPAGANTVDLVGQLNDLVTAFPGGAGVWIGDPNAPAALFTHGADEPVITASLYKLGVLAEAERRVESGELSYSSPIVIQPEDITEDGSFHYAGALLSLDEALEAMITISDNGPALALWHVLGGANIDATLADAGVADFHVALDESEENWATPQAIGTFFTLLAKGQLISPAASDRMLARLSRQQINDRLPAHLPEGVRVAHKTGNLPGVTHDAGIIYTKTGPRVVVVLTWDAFDDDAYHFISSIGAAVYGSALEPAANARYRVPRNAVSAEVGSVAQVMVPITNIGRTGWMASGPGSTSSLRVSRAHTS